MNNRSYNYTMHEEVGSESCCCSGPAACEERHLQQQQLLAAAAASQHVDVLQQQEQEQHQRLLQQHQQQPQQREQEKLPGSLMCESTYHVKIDSTTVWQVPTRLKFVKKIGSGAYGCVASFEENLGRAAAAAAAECSSGSEGGSRGSLGGAISPSSKSSLEGRGGTPGGNSSCCSGGGGTACSSCGRVERDERSRDTAGEGDEGGDGDGAGRRKKRLAVKKIGDLFRDLIDAKRIYREIKILKELKHENIISLVEILDPLSPDFDDIYLVSDLMDTDLHRVIYSRQALTTEHHQYFLYQLLLGLSFLHQAEIIHRDLKPSNILVNLNCDIKICDFGLARGLHIAQGPPHVQQQQQSACDCGCCCCCAAAAASATPRSNSSTTSSIVDTTISSTGRLPTAIAYGQQHPQEILRQRSVHQLQSGGTATAAAAAVTGRAAAAEAAFPLRSSSTRLVPTTTSSSGSGNGVPLAPRQKQQHPHHTQKHGGAAAAAATAPHTAECCCCGGATPNPAAAFACEEAARNLELTDYVVTRWYRPPEILISPFYYSKPVDLWSVGCIFAELLGRRALFAGKDHFDQLRKIIRIMGRPSSAELNKIVNEGRSYPIYTSSSSRRFGSKCGCAAAAASLHGEGAAGKEKDSKGGCKHCRKAGDCRGTNTKHKRSDAAKKFIESLPYNEPYNLADLFPDASAAAIDLLAGLLAFDPENRLTVQEALRHEYFEGLHSPEDEPRAVSPVDWSFDNFVPTKRLLQNKVYEEILSFHPEIVLRDFPVLPSRGILISPASLPPHVRNPLALLQQRAATSSSTSRSSSFSSICSPPIPPTESFNVLQQQQQQKQQQVRQQEVSQQQQQREQETEQQVQRQGVEQQKPWQHQMQQRQPGQEQSLQQAAQQRQVQQQRQQEQQGDSDEKSSSLSARCRGSSSRTQRRPQEELRTVAEHRQHQHLSPTTAAGTATAADRSSVTTSASSLPCCSSPDASIFADLSTQQQQQALLRLLPAPGSARVGAAAAAAAASSTAALPAPSPVPVAAAEATAAAAADTAQRSANNSAAAVERCNLGTRSMQQDEAQKYFSLHAAAAVYDYHVGGNLQQPLQQQQQHVLPLQQQQQQVPQQLHQPAQHRQHVQHEPLQQQQPEKGGAEFDGSRCSCAAGYATEGQAATALGGAARGTAAPAPAREHVVVPAAAGRLSPHAAAAAKCEGSERMGDWYCSSGWQGKRSSIRRRELESSSASAAENEAGAVDAAAAASSLTEAPGDAELLTALQMLQGCHNNSSGKSTSTGDNAARRTTAGSRPSTNPSASLSSLPRTATSFSLPSAHSLTPCCPERSTVADQQRGNVVCCASSLAGTAASASAAVVHEEEVFGCSCAPDSNTAAAAGTGLRSSVALVDHMGGCSGSRNSHLEGVSSQQQQQQAFYNEAVAAPGTALPGGVGGAITAAGTPQLGGGGGTITTAGATPVTAGGVGTAVATLEGRGTGGQSGRLAAAGGRETLMHGEEDSKGRSFVPSWHLEGRTPIDIQETSSSSSTALTESAVDAIAAEGDSPSSSHGIITHALAEGGVESRSYTRLDGAAARSVVASSPSSSYASSPTYAVPATSQLPTGAVPPLAQEHQQRRSTETASSGSSGTSGISCCSITRQQQPHGVRGEDGDETAAGATLLLLAAQRDTGSETPALLASAAPVDNNIAPQPRALPFFSDVRTQQQPRETVQQEQQRGMGDTALPWTRQQHAAQQQPVQHPTTVPFVSRHHGGHQTVLFPSLHPAAGQLPPQSSSIEQQRQPQLPRPFECSVNPATRGSSTTCFQQHAASTAAQTLSPAAVATGRKSGGAPLGRTVSAASIAGCWRGLAPIDALRSAPQHQQQLRAAAAAVLPARRASALETADGGAGRSHSDSSCGGCCCSPFASSVATTTMHVSQLGVSVCSRSRSKPEPTAAAAAAFAVSMGSEQLPLPPADSAAFLLSDFDRRDTSVSDVSVFARPGDRAPAEGRAAGGATETDATGVAIGPLVSDLTCGLQNTRLRWHEAGAVCSGESLAEAAAAGRPRTAAGCCCSSGGRHSGVGRSEAVGSSHHPASSCDCGGHPAFLLEGRTADELHSSEGEQQQQQQQTAQLAAGVVSGSVFRLVERFAQQRETIANRAAFLQGVYALQQQQHQQGQEHFSKQQERTRAASADVEALRSSLQQDVIMGESEEVSDNNRSRYSRDSSRCSGIRRAGEETAVLCATAAAVNAAADGGRGTSSCCMDVDFFLQQEAAQQTLLLSAIREQQQQQMRRVPARGGSFSEHATQVLHENHHPSHGLQKKHARPPGHHVKS